MKLTKEIQLINVEDGHHKQWCGQLFDDNTVITSWGKIGATPQSKEFSFETPEEAEAFLNKKETEKLKKKYVPAENNEEE